MRSMKSSAVSIIASLSLGGAVFQVGGCGNVFGFLRNYNPCGVVLQCDPVTFRFLTSGYEGPGVDPEIDPACTFPPFCANDPFVATQGGG